MQQPYHYGRTNVKVIVLCPGLADTLEDLSQDYSDTEIVQSYQPQKWVNHYFTHPRNRTEKPQKVKSVVRVESVAHGLVYVIRCAQNGSVWISEDGKPVYEVQLPDSLPQKKNEIDVEESAVDAKLTGS